MENQRIRLSKSMLKQALICLLKTKAIEKITVYELCQQAQINRTTFYKYYGSPYGLLDDIENDLFRELEKLLATGMQAEFDCLVQVLRYLDAEQEKCCVLINTVPDQEFSEKLFRLPAIHALLQNHMPDHYTEKQQEYIKLFVCQGGYAIIRQWLNKENRETPEEIASLLNALSTLILRPL
jgi:AcrR family transcriptional regulator